MDDVQDAALWKRQSMKEKLVAVERQRKNLQELVTDYLKKHGNQASSSYTELLQELENDKAK